MNMRGGKYKEHANKNTNPIAPVVGRSFLLDMLLLLTVIVTDAERNHVNKRPGNECLEPGDTRRLCEVAAITVTNVATAAPTPKLERTDHQIAIPTGSRCRITPIAR